MREVIQRCGRVDAKRAATKIVELGMDALCADGEVRVVWMAWMVGVCIGARE